jgi:hypothetical protein
MLPGHCRGAAEALPGRGGGWRASAHEPRIGGDDGRNKSFKLTDCEEKETYLSPLISFLRLLLTSLFRCQVPCRVPPGVEPRQSARRVFDPVVIAFCLDFDEKVGLRADSAWTKP